MTERTKQAVIIAIGIDAAVALYVYYSPYQTWVRAYAHQENADMGRMVCAETG